MCSRFALLAALFALGSGCDDAATLSSPDPTSPFSPVPTSDIGPGNIVAADGDGGPERVSGSGSVAGRDAGVRAPDAVVPPPSPDTPPWLKVSAPARGFFTRGAGVEVSGEASDADGPVVVTVAGEVTPTDNRDHFDHRLALTEPGTQVLTTEATDEANHTVTDHRAVLYGERLEPERPLSDGVVLQLSPGALDSVADGADRFFTPEALEAMIQNPVLDRAQRFCAFVCYTAWAIRMNVYEPTFEGLTATMVPFEDRLLVTFVMRNFSALWDGRGVVSQIGYGGHGRITAEVLEVVLGVFVEWDGEAPVVRTELAEVRSQGFHFDFDDFMYRAMQFFGLNLDAFVVGMVESTFAAMLREQMPAALLEIFRMFEIHETLSVNGRDYQLDAVPNGLLVRPEAVTVGLASTVNGERLRPARRARGSLVVASEPPPPMDTDRFVANIDLDLINQLLSTLWSGGAFDQRGPPEAFGVDPQLVGLLAPGVENLRLSTAALLPPTLTRSTRAEDAGRFAVGDLLLRIVDADADAGQTLIEVATSVEGTLSFTAAPNGVRARLDDAQAVATVISPEGLPLSRVAALEAAVAPVAARWAEAQVAQLGLPFSGAEGFILSEIEATAEVHDSGFFRVLGRLDPE